MRSLRKELLHVAYLYASAIKTKGRDGGLSLSGISTRVFGDGKTFARIEAGGDLTTGNFERAMRWFSEHWPEGAEWPADVMRPAAAQPAASGEEAA